MAEKRVYPSILINKSGTRREELLLKPEILQKTWTRKMSESARARALRLPLTPRAADLVARALA
jgi:transcription termination factor Rho